MEYNPSLIPPIQTITWTNDAIPWANSLAYDCMSEISKLFLCQSASIITIFLLENVWSLDLLIL